MQYLPNLPIFYLLKLDVLTISEKIFQGIIANSREYISKVS